MVNSTRKKVAILGKKIDGFAMTPERKRKETKGKILMMLFDTANNTFDFEMTAGH